MAIDRDTFFAQLEALTEQEIEQRLPLFDTEQLSLVQEYVDQKTIDRIKAALQSIIEPTESYTKAAAALEGSRSANKKATIALIFALGAWLTAITTVIVGYLQKG